MHAPKFDFRYLRLRFDAMTGGFERQAQRLANKVDWSAWREGWPTVLCLDRAQFRKDVDELRKHTRYNWVKVRATAVKHAQEPWIYPPYRLQTFFTHYLESCADYLKPWLQRFGENFLDAVNHVHPIAAVMAGNIDYWQDEAIKLGCRSRNIPFLVLGRENYTKSISVELLQRRFRESKFHFAGTGVAVLSEDTRKALIGSGLFASESIWVTGAPRYDCWSDIVPAPISERKALILLSYANPLYMAPTSFAECAAIFAEESRRYVDSGLDFLIKVKKPAEIDRVRRAFPDVDNYPVRIVWDTALYDLFPQSRIVIGFNTLAILEALLTDVPVVVPSWGDARRPVGQALMHYENPLDLKVAHFPDSPAALRALIGQAVAGNLAAKGTDVERHDRFFRHIAMPRQGTSSAAIERFVDHYVGLAEKERATQAQNP